MHHQLTIDHGQEAGVLCIQLQTQFHHTRSDKVNDMIIYRPAKVQLPATVNDSEVVYKEADLVVAARDVPLLQEEDSSLSEFAGLRKPKQVVLEDGAVKISPMSSPRSPATVPVPDLDGGEVEPLVISSRSQGAR